MAQDERFVEMSGESGAVPMIGRLEYEDGTMGCAWVDANGDLLSYVGHFSPPGGTSTHTRSWNYVRGVALFAAGAERSSGSNYWPENPVACALSLAMRIGDREAKAGRLPGWAETKGAVKAAKVAVDSSGESPAEADIATDVKLLREALFAFALGLGVVATENDVGGLRDIANALSVATVDDA